ncbi:hypothetical protein [Gordonia malaquae]|uniref:hypothetical protein n=1 Tax=Gordonia malaquae TaxID=410332 RepID=UPI003019D037
MEYFTQRSWITVADDEVPPALYIALSTLGHWSTVLKRRRNTDADNKLATAQRNHALRAAIALGCSDKQIQHAVAGYSTADVARFREIALGEELDKLTVSAGLQRDFIAGFDELAIEEFGSQAQAEDALMEMSPRFLELLERYETERDANLDWRNALRWKLAQYRMRPRGDHNGLPGPALTSLFIGEI